jgi:hypothetical protein
VLPLMSSKLVVPGRRWLRSKLYMYVYYTKKKIGNESSILRFRQANRYGVDIQMGRSLSTRVKSKAKQPVFAVRASRMS